MERLKRAVEATHECKATLVESELVFLNSGNAFAWDGVVAVFKLSKHSTAKICYAWGYSDETDEDFVTVLGMPLIKSARAAVQAHMAFGAGKIPVESAPRS